MPKITRLPQILLTTALFLFLAGCVPVQPITVRAQAGSGETEALWVDVSWVRAWWTGSTTRPAPMTLPASII